MAEKIEAGEEDLEQAVRRKTATQQLGSSRTTARAKTIACHKMRERDTQVLNRLDGDPSQAWSPGQKGGMGDVAGGAGS